MGRALGYFLVSLREEKKFGSAIALGLAGGSF
jgi:hypothetical protein